MPRKTELPSLANAAWLKAPALQQVLAVLNGNGGETRVAGGAVRNELLGEAVTEVDLATTFAPHDVMKRAKAAGFGVHPTGLDHGTITVVNQRVPFEVTTLRRDVETDGRHAVVSFTTDWAEDARRRDFTINALYCDAAGTVFDFTGGHGDIRKRHVRFVGSASARIREDYLRILRFFRFHARFGKGTPDAAGLSACTRLKAGITRLSAERLRQEMLKLLVASRAVPTLKVMAKAGILRKIIPYKDDWRTLSRLPADGILRLFVLAGKPAELKDLLRLSNAEGGRLEALQDAVFVSPALSEAERRRILYHVGVGGWRDAVWLSLARSRARLDDPAWHDLLALPEQWTIPRFPVGGADLKAHGMPSGPAMGATLRALEDWWIASDFKPGKDDILRRAGLEGKT